MLLRLETNPVFTQNYQDLETQEKHWISTFWRARPPQEVSDTGYSSRSARHYGSSTLTEDLRGNLRTWSLEDEVRVMARVQAYFHVAYKVSITIPDAMPA